MSGAENEAVEAALTRLAQWIEPQYGDLQAVNAERAMRIAYDAMRGPIARDVIAGICRREGHSRVEMTPLDSLELVIRCGRCGETWNEPRPEPASGGPARYAFAEPEAGGCFVPHRSDARRSRAMLESAGATFGYLTDATEVTLTDSHGNVVGVVNLSDPDPAVDTPSDGKCPGCREPIGIYLVEIEPGRSVPGRWHCDTWGCEYGRWKAGS